MEDIGAVLARWKLDVAGVRERIYRATSAREREHWPAVWLLARGWTAAQVAEALDRDPHTVGEWAAAFREHGPAGRAFTQSGGSPPPALTEEQQDTLKAAIPQEPRDVGVPLATWTWKAVRQFVQDRAGVTLSRSSCLRYLHRLGFVWKRPKKRLTKADPDQRAAFVREYVGLLEEAKQTGAKICFVDEAHFRADVDLRGRWVPRVSRPW